MGLLFCYETIPSRKPFLDLLGISFKYLMRPVPVVFLLIAFTDQLSEDESVSLRRQIA